jgi:hypothetical protein
VIGRPGTLREGIIAFNNPKRKLDDGRKRVNSHPQSACKHNTRVERIVLRTTGGTWGKSNVLERTMGKGEMPQKVIILFGASIDIIKLVPVALRLLMLLLLLVSRLVFAVKLMFTRNVNDFKEP